MCEFCVIHLCFSSRNLPYFTLYVASEVSKGGGFRQLRTQFKWHLCFCAVPFRGVNSCGTGAAVFCSLFRILVCKKSSD
jgi:hypothetical protein